MQKLRHENLVSMIEVFRRRKRLYLVFEYLDHTVLDELEQTDGGLDWGKSRKYIFQILRGLEFCHNHKASKGSRKARDHTRDCTLIHWEKKKYTRKKCLVELTKFLVKDMNEKIG